jgi:hypothetical protein
MDFGDKKYQIFKIELYSNYRVILTQNYDDLNFLNLINL